MTEVLCNLDTPAPTKKAKAKEPDTFEGFDGSDSHKLNNFILLCNLYFRSSSTYDNDSAKVNFTLFYFQGTALELFEPIILDSSETPNWSHDWSTLSEPILFQLIHPPMPQMTLLI